MNAKTRAFYGALSRTSGAPGKAHEEPSEKSGSQNWDADLIYSVLR